MRMKIKNKLALMYTVLTLTLLTVLCVSIYYRFEYFTRDNFFQRITERAFIVAKFHLDKDDVSTTIYESIIKEYLQILPLEKEYIFQINQNNFSIIQDSLPIPESFIAEISQHNIAYHIDHDLLSWVGIYYPDNQGDFVVLVTALDESGILKLDKLRNILVSGVLISTMILFFVGRWFAGIMLNPMSKITRYVKKIKAHNLHLRVPEPTQKDELRELSVTFNEMLNSLEMTLNVHQNFINNASHELKTPLTSILGEAEYALSKSRTAEEYERIVGNINKAALRLEKLTYELLQLNHSYTKISPEFFDTLYLDEVIYELLYTDEKYGEQKIQFQPSTDNHRRSIKANKQLIQIALRNVLDNALKFSNRKGIVVTSWYTENMITLEVTDRGIGIPPDEIVYVTQPLYRGANVKTFSGYGIGLSLTENIIKLHGGCIKVRSEQNKGTKVSIALPTC